MGTSFPNGQRDLSAIALEPKASELLWVSWVPQQALYLSRDLQTVYIRHGFPIEQHMHPKESLLIGISLKKTYRWPTGT